MASPPQDSWPLRHCLTLYSNKWLPPPPHLPSSQSVSQPAEWMKKLQPGVISHDFVIWQEVRTEVREECYLESACIHVGLAMWTVAMAIVTRVGVAVSCQGGVPCKGMILTPAMSDMLRSATAQRGCVLNGFCSAVSDYFHVLHVTGTPVWTCRVSRWGSC